MTRHLILHCAVGLIGSALAAGVCLIGGRLPLTLGYELNITPSEPVGIYRLVGGQAERRALVLLKQPHDSMASVLSRYAPVHLPLIKRVAAIPGDLVEINTFGMRVNGILWPHSVPLAHDAEGRSLRPYPFGVYRVHAGELWVLSNHPRGLDSRYFGPVLEPNVISRLVPVLTWSSPLTSQALALGYVLCLMALGILVLATSVNTLRALVIEPRSLK